MNQYIFTPCWKLLGMALFCLLPFISTAQEQPNIVGKWRGTDSAGEVATVQFDKDGSVVFSKGRDVIGGRKKGAPLLKYEFNFSQSPVWLDLIFYNQKGKELERVKTIVKFLEPHKMLWRLDEKSAERPAEFDEDNTITLEKIAD